MSDDLRDPVADADMLSTIREITMEVNGKNEPAFLDDAVRKAFVEIAETMKEIGRKDERERLARWYEDRGVHCEGSDYFSTTLEAIYKGVSREIRRANINDRNKI